MCEHSAKSWRPSHAYIYMYIYSYILFTLKQTSVALRVSELPSVRNPGFSSSYLHDMSPQWSSSWSPTGFLRRGTARHSTAWHGTAQPGSVGSAQPRTAVGLWAQPGCARSSCTLHFALVVCWKFSRQLLFTTYQWLGHRLLSSLPISWKERSNIYLLPFHRVRTLNVCTPCASVKEHKIQSQNCSLVPVCHIGTSI